MNKASNNLLYLSILTTFLDKAGAKSLPWVYLLVNLLFIVFQFQFMTRIVGREGHWLLSAITWPAVALSLAAAFVFPVDTVPRSLRIDGGYKAAILKSSLLVLAYFCSSLVTKPRTVSLRWI